jgi:3-isopropylmalate dehydrogenase
MPDPTLLILAGDGIGPEVMAEVRKVIDWFGRARGLRFAVDEDLVGGCSYDAHGTPLTDAAMARAQAADAVLLGAVGGPKYDALDFSLKPERGLLRLRKEMDLYANLRPAQCFDALADFSSLKPEVVAGLDILIIRELTSGVYFGEPRGIIREGNERVGINTQRYTESEIARVARSAFALARQRSNKVCSMEKANVMESGVLWRQVVTEVHEAEFPDVELSHMYADAGAMQLTRWPKQFDVIVTDNLFGDIITDLAAAITGGIGLAASGNINPDRTAPSMFEPVHGSAPDIAGRQKADPTAAILSTSLLLDHLGYADAAAAVERAAIADMAERVPGAVRRTAEVGDAIAARL